MTNLEEYILNKILNKYQMNTKLSFPPTIKRSFDEFALSSDAKR
jgi:hypothetical protein